MGLSENMIVTFASTGCTGQITFHFPSCHHTIFQPLSGEHCCWKEWGQLQFKWDPACSVAQLCLTLCDRMDRGPPGSFCPWDFPGKNTRVACHFLLQGLFSTQGSNLHLLPCRQILYPWAMLWNISEWEYFWTGLAQFKQRAFPRGLCC